MKNKRQKRYSLLKSKNVLSFNENNFLIFKKKNLKIIYTPNFVALESMLKQSSKLDKQSLNLVGILERKTEDY